MYSSLPILFMVLKVIVIFMIDSDLSEKSGCSKRKHAYQVSLSRSFLGIFDIKKAILQKMKVEIGKPQVSAD